MRCASSGDSRGGGSGPRRYRRRVPRSSRPPKTGAAVMVQSWPASRVSPGSRGARPVCGSSSRPSVARNSGGAPPGQAVEAAAVGAEDGRDPVEDGDEETRPEVLGRDAVLLDLRRDLLLQLEDLGARRERVEKLFDAERVLHARLQLAGGEGLRDIVVRERFEALQEVFLLGAGGHEDDLRACGRSRGLDAPADLVAGEVGHADVEKNDVRRARVHLFEGLGAGKGALEVAPQLVGDVRRDFSLIRIVVHEEEQRGCGRRSEHRDEGYSRTLLAKTRAVAENRPS